MGGASSKAARTLPKTAKPSWAGARTPGPSDPRPGPSGSRRIPEDKPVASETRTEAIEQDARDPQFLAKLNQLGPVTVDHHMNTFRPAANATQHAYETRMQSELEARSPHSTRNRLLAGALSDLLEDLKYISSRDDMIALARRYDIDVSKLESVARVVNTPTVDPASVVREVGDDGTEKVTMKVMWKHPPVLQ